MITVPFGPQPSRMDVLYGSPGTIAHWVSCNKFTVQANCIGRTVVWTAPFTQKFVGQPIQNLLRWAASFGGMWHEILP